MGLNLSKLKYLKLPAETKAILKWYSWIVWENHKDTKLKYETFISYTENIISAMSLDFDILPVVTENNYMKIWFQCEKELDKESLRNMEHEFYTMKKRYNGYSVIEDK